MPQCLVDKYSYAVPRYTSYPTAPHFNSDISNSDYADWIEALGEGDSLSLYLHIPYCDRLCWFCACHTKHTLKYEPISTYLKALHKEIETVSSHVKSSVKVTAIHFGGGSPTMLRPDDIIELVGLIRQKFMVSSDAEISVEMDPNDLDEGRYEALAQIGMTRASLGVQDFDEKVQKTINRLQSFEQTKSVVDSVRLRGVHSVNCDILYGLPYQTLETLAHTVGQIITLDPDRIALFGYAHVPWMKKHQTLIPESALPDKYQRFEQMTLATKILIDAGYVQIGIDHFAKQNDRLAQADASNRLRRNFQGYTDDNASSLIGLGASSISSLPQGYVQNIPATGEYQKAAESGELCAVRGIAFTDDDLARRWLIEKIMCFQNIEFNELVSRFSVVGQLLVSEIKYYNASDSDGLTLIHNDVFSLTDIGKIFARIVASSFDGYLLNGKGRHSVAV